MFIQCLPPLGKWQITCEVHTISPAAVGPAALAHSITVFLSACGMNVHHRCQTKVANLCGINQKLMAEALAMIESTQQVGKACSYQNPISARSRPGPLPASGTTVWDNMASISEPLSCPFHPHTHIPP